jgi:hypothetical protein
VAVLQERHPGEVLGPGGVLGELLKVLKIFLISLIEIKRLPTSLNLILSWIARDILSSFLARGRVGLRIGSGVPLGTGLTLTGCPEGFCSREEL